MHQTRNARLLACWPRQCASFRLMQAQPGSNNEHACVAAPEQESTGMQQGSTTHLHTGKL
jgi:hypothetical protein